MGLFRRKKAPRIVETASPVAIAQTTRAAELTVGDYANGIPNIKLGAMLGSFGRQLIWLVPLFLLGAIPAWWLTRDFKRTYSGEGTIMVQLGDEYVYQPVAGSGAQGSLLQTPDTITLNEVAIVKNPEVMDRVLGEMMSRPGGVKRFAPDIARKLNRPTDTLAYQLAYMELRKKMDSEFFVAARPKSSIIDMSYRHEDPQLAVSTLNALMDAYMSYRRTVFVEGAGDLIAQRRQDTETQLKTIDRQISAFLAKNGISDFDSEQKGASKRTEDLKASLNGERASIAETERALAVVEDQLRNVPETINLYVDDRASNRIAQAELELKQLLAKYLPTSDPVQQKQREISEMRDLLRANNGQATGGRRVGPNPVFQELLTRRNTLQATANSLREKEFTLQRQLNSVDGKLARLTQLSPAFNDLLRERDTLTNRLRTYLSKEQEALINQQQAEASAENVRVISNATYPIKGRNMRALAFFMAMVAWGFTLFMLALFRVFADPRLYAVPGVRRAVPEPLAEPAYVHDPIPEPLAPYEPAAPIPDEYAPAAYAQPAPSQHYGDGAHVPAEWQAQPYGGYDAAAAAPYADPYAAQAYDPAQAQPVAYAPTADGTVAWSDAQAPADAGYGAQGDGQNAYADNPYASGASAAPIDPYAR